MSAPAQSEGEAWNVASSCSRMWGWWYVELSKTYERVAMSKMEGCRTHASLAAVLIQSLHNV
jgi:hypothetical protein